MNLIPVPYHFTIADTEKIVDLGYVIKHTCAVSFETFVAREFTNLDLVSLLQELERSFKPLTTLKIDRSIFYDSYRIKLQINYSNDFRTDDEALMFNRTFLKMQNGIQVHHDMCVLPLIHQGQGKVKKVFQVSLQQYVNMNVQSIHVYAGLTGGGHVWGRHGFVAVNKLEVEHILAEAKTTLNGMDYEAVERIFNTYYTKHPDGKEFPMRLWAMLDCMKPILRGATWHGY